MKRIILSLLAASSLIASCTKDNTTPNPYYGKKWHAILHADTITVTKDKVSEWKSTVLLVDSVFSDCPQSTAYDYCNTKSSGNVSFKYKGTNLDSIRVIVTIWVTQLN